MRSRCIYPNGQQLEQTDGLDLYPKENPPKKSSKEQKPKQQPKKCQLFMLLCLENLAYVFFCNGPSGAQNVQVIHEGYLTFIFSLGHGYAVDGRIIQGFNMDEVLSAALPTRTLVIFGGEGADVGASHMTQQTIDRYTSVVALLELPLLPNTSSPFLLT